MTPDKIDPSKDNSITRDITAFTLLIASLVLLTFGILILWGTGGLLVFYGLVCGVLGVTMGLSRTGKG